MRRSARFLPLLVIPPIALAGCIPGPRPDAGGYDAPARSQAPPRQPNRYRPPDDQPEPPPEPHDERAEADQPVTPAQVARPRSAWTARSVSADAADIPGSTYIVRAGDNLHAIGDRTGAGQEAIARGERDRAALSDPRRPTPHHSRRPLPPRPIGRERDRDRACLRRAVGADRRGEPA